MVGWGPCTRVQDDGTLVFVELISLDMLASSGLQT
jgi:hypothetical protein